MSPKHFSIRPERDCCSIQKQLCFTSVLLLLVVVLYTLFEILRQHIMSSSSSAAAGCFKVRSANWSKNAKPIIDCVVGKKVQSRQSSQRRPHRNRTTTTRLVGQRKKKTMIAAKAASSSFTPPQEEEKTQQSDDQKTFIPAHMRKTVSRITEAQMKENGVELAKASEQVQESIGTSVV